MCLNRVVQHPLRLKLQLFKTARRGWGVRTLHDIPRGGFICVYVGKMLNETIANEVWIFLTLWFPVKNYQNLENNV